MTEDAKKRNASVLDEIMEMPVISEDKIDEAMQVMVDTLMADYGGGRDIDNMKFFQQPDQGQIIDIINKFMVILFPGYHRDQFYRTRNQASKISVVIEDVMYHLRKQIEIVLLYDPAYQDAPKEVRKNQARKICIRFFQQIPKIRSLLDTDLQATFDGDPAANSKDEIVLCYPGLYATAIYRLAHELVLLNVPIIPRIMSEYAHRETGVDIHPAATIGNYFFIDHATGIVVGSTSVIGDHVKLYQGVTIGALSTKEGHKLHGTKRHPTIEDDVTLYSGASILGGDTVIGEGSVIGGNAFITRSVPPHSRVNIKAYDMVYAEKED